jgi:hypothetical protein
MAETEPKGGLSPDYSFMLAWTVNRFEALDPESLASAIADATARLHDESLDAVTRVAYGSLWLAIRTLQLGASPAEGHQRLVEYQALFKGDASPG